MSPIILHGSELNIVDVVETGRGNVLTRVDLLRVDSLLPFLTFWFATKVSPFVAFIFNRAVLPTSRIVPYKTGIIPTFDLSIVWYTFTFFRLVFD